jgi:hypothetical protein
VRAQGLVADGDPGSRVAARTLPVVLLLLLAAGCGDDGGARGAEVTLTTSAEPPGHATRVRLSGFDQFGDTRFTSPDQAAAPVVTFGGLPADVVTVEIDYLDALGDRVGTFSTSVDLDAPLTIADPPAVDPDDPIVASLAFLGCNRIGDGAADDNLPSTANVANLVQTSTELPAPPRPPPLPSPLFFVGDLVVSHHTGTDTLRSQLQGWKAVYDGSPLPNSAVQLVTAAGNHEMLAKVELDGEGVEVSNAAAGAVFTSEMADFIPTGNGPTPEPPNPDGVQRDESRLSFSFRNGDRFFVLLDTDTYVGDDSPDGIGYVPLHWLRDQLTQAQNDPTIAHVFVFGHKPIVGQEGEGETIAPSQLEAFTSLLCDPSGSGAPTKVRGYFCAHAHYWHYDSLPCPSSNGRLNQIINGNGGTSVENDFFEPPHGFFGYTVLGVTGRGGVVLQAWGRFVTEPDDLPGQAATTLREHRTLFSPERSGGSAPRVVGVSDAPRESEGEDSASLPRWGSGAER